MRERGPFPKLLDFGPRRGLLLIVISTVTVTSINSIIIISSSSSNIITVSSIIVSINVTRVITIISSSIISGQTRSSFAVKRICAFVVVLRHARVRSRTRVRYLD